MADNDIKFHYHFDPSLPSSSYTATNLGKFVTATSSLTGRDYTSMFIEILNEARSDLRRRGINPASRQYKGELDLSRYNYVYDLYQRGILADIPNPNATYLPKIPRFGNYGRSDIDFLF